MNRPLYRFDQLFEKMPNGSYRERPKPVAPPDIFHRHDFVRSGRTGRIIVVYPAISWDDAIKRGWVTFEPLASGDWFYGPRLNWSFGFQSPEEVGAVWGGVMMQAAGCAVGSEQQSSSGGTNGGITETPTA